MNKKILSKLYFAVFFREAKNFEFFSTYVKKEARFDSILKKFYP